MVTGPQNMPKFSDRQLTPEEKQDIIAYVKSAAEARTPAATASAGSVRRPRVWPSGPSESSLSSAQQCGSDQGHEWTRSTATWVKNHTEEELDAMSRDELVELGTNLDGVDVVYRRERWPVEGTKAEKRAERTVAFWFAVAGLCRARVHR